ncbi:MAG: hypothetical protein IKI54_03770 [Lachnospiraceae bacterium]|nr:hypothetical protein [Lachnospiraceae bacterium]
MDRQSEGGMSAKGAALLGVVGGFLATMILIGILFAIVWFASGRSIS